MKKTGKLSMLLAAAMSAALITMPITANAASMTYDMVYDMDNNDVSSMATNRGENNQNSDLADDPLNSSNKVWKTKSDSSGNGNIVADMNFSPDNGKYIQIEFDLLKEGKDNFQTIVYDSKSWINGIEALNMTSSGNVDCKTSNGSKYEINKWYSFKLILDTEKTQYMLWMKAKGESEYGYLADYTATNQTFSADKGFRLRFGAGSSYTYLDNIKISALNSCDKNIHYEFNDVQTVVNQPYFNSGANCTAITWSQAEFDGEKVLEGKLNAASAAQPYTGDKIPDMDKVIIEARLGFDSRDAEGVLKPEENLPMQFGFIPVFADDKGKKDLSGWRPRTNGIVFNNTRSINIEGTTYDKNKGTDTINGYNLSDGRLYTAGYVYDRINKKFKAYFITNHGETIVKDASEIKNRDGKAVIDEQRYLAGVQLWLRADEDYLTGKGYYDYLRIDEPEEFVKKSVQAVGDKDDMSLMPQINIDYNYVIDPDCLSAASVRFTPEGESQDTSGIPASLSTYNGKTLVVTPSQPLNPSTRYVMTVCAGGIKDLLGQEADAVETTFTTGTEIKATEVTLADGTLKDGKNTAKLTLSSNDGVAHDVALIAGIYDKTTNALLSTISSIETVLAKGNTDLSLDFDTTGYSNYKVKIFVWDGFNTMIPYISTAEFIR